MGGGEWGVGGGGGVGGSLCYRSLERKCRFNGHVEIVFSVNCELDQNIPVSRDKAAKTDPWVRHVRAGN